MQVCVCVVCVCVCVRALPYTCKYSTTLLYNIPLSSPHSDILAHIMNDLFGGVVYAGIDTDRYKYPIGSGRVTFGNQRSFMRAVKAGFVEIKTPKFSKKVRLHDSHY